MASEESISLLAHKDVLRSFFLSETETCVEQNLHHGCTHHDSSMHQQVAAKDAPEMAHVLDAKRENVEWIIKKKQAHRAQVAALLEMQLQALQ